MAIVTCPGCKKMVSDSSGKCPNCGAGLKSKTGVSDKSTPAIKKLQTFNMVFMYVAGIMVLLDIFEIFTTYVGGLLLGSGIFVQAYLQYRKGKDEGNIEKRKVIAVVIVGVLTFAAGILNLYLALTK